MVDNGIRRDWVAPVASASSSGSASAIALCERATLVGGNVEIESAPGKGTTIYARVPFFNDGTDIAEARGCQ